jgi:nucleoside-diphosphate-sugar epimerase
MGPAVDERPRTEDCIRPARDPYGASKWQAEQGLRELCRGTGMDLVIVRPPLVYGPAPRGNLHLLDRGARLGIPPPPQGGARSMVGLEDLTGLLAELMWRAPPGQHTWIVSDGERYTARNIFDLLCRAHGRSPGRSWVPARGWHLACSVLDRLQGWPAGSAREKLFGTELYDSTALRRDIGWRPTQTLADVAPLIAAR